MFPDQRENKEEYPRWSAPFSRHILFSYFTIFCKKYISSSFIFLNRIYIRKEYKASMSKTWEKYFFENHEFSKSSGRKHKNRNYDNHDNKSIKIQCIQQEVYELYSYINFMHYDNFIKFCLIG